MEEEEEKEKEEEENIWGRVQGGRGEREGKARKRTRKRTRKRKRIRRSKKVDIKRRKHRMTQREILEIQT